MHDFWNAYSGSEILGRPLLEYRDKVKAVLFGHHNYKKLKYKRIRECGVEFINVDMTAGIEAAEILSL